MTYKNITILANATFSNYYNDEDLVVYSIVRESLDMSAGKISGQCQHAIQYLINKYYYVKYNTKNELGDFFINRYECWANNKYNTKVVLTASDKEWNKLKEEYDPIIVIDAGKTEIPTGSETVMILYPMLKEERSKTLKRCRAL